MPSNPPPRCESHFFLSALCVRGRTKLRAPEKAVEAVVTALLTSAQRTTAAVTLLAGGPSPGEDDEDDAV